jgi:LuxR family maltose regulon positive regulatory protein
MRAERLPESEPGPSMPARASRDARGHMRHKITPPVTSQYAIERTRILGRIQQFAGTKVVLVHAPAGYGKTTTLVQLHRQLTARAIDCAWVQLDVADNDVSCFASSLQRALVSAADTSRPQQVSARRARDPMDALLDAMSIVIS